MIQTLTKQTLSNPKGGNPNWKKGVSGNPGGRPKQVLDVIYAAREHTAEALKTLASIMKTGESEQARNQAAKILLDRGWGQAAQVIDQTTHDEAKEDKLLQDYTIEELEAFLDFAREKRMAQAQKAGTLGKDV